MGEPIANHKEEYIYVIERGIMMNGHEMHYDNVHYSSTFEEAVEYVKKEFNEFLSYGEEINREEEFRLLQVNYKYWTASLDFESTMGIMKVKLDKPLYEDIDEDPNIGINSMMEDL